MRPILEECLYTQFSTVVLTHSGLRTPTLEGPGAQVLLCRPGEPPWPRQGPAPAPHTSFCFRFPLDLFSLSFFDFFFLGRLTRSSGKKSSKPSRPPSSSSGGIRRGRGYSAMSPGGDPLPETQSERRGCWDSQFLCHPALPGQPSCLPTPTLTLPAPTFNPQPSHHSFSLWTVPLPSLLPIPQSQPLDPVSGIPALVGCVSSLTSRPLLSSSVKWDVTTTHPGRTVLRQRAQPK